MKNSFTDKEGRTRVMNVVLRLDDFLFRNAVRRRTNSDVEQACVHVEGVRCVCEEVLADPENEELWGKLHECMDEGFAFFSR